MPVDHTKPQQEICPKCDGYTCVDYGPKFKPNKMMKLAKCTFKSHHDWNCYVCSKCSGIGWIGRPMDSIPAVPNPTADQIWNRKRVRSRERRKEISTLFKKE